MRMAADDWPDALTPPTGSGKTAVIDAWLWARLHGRPVPRRLVYVIDRRLVVDGVTEYALALAASLDPQQQPAVVTLRGGLTVEEIVRQELRPLLSAWLNANLPRVVEEAVARELERVRARIG